MKKQLLLIVMIIGVLFSAKAQIKKENKVSPAVDKAAKALTEKKADSVLSLQYTIALDTAQVMILYRADDNTIVFRDGYVIRQIATFPSGKKTEEGSQLFTDKFVMITPQDAERDQLWKVEPYNWKKK